MDDEQVVNRLVQVAGGLRGCWEQALGLRVERGVWDELGPALNSGDHDVALHAIHGWYVHAILIRCRRLLDGDNNSEGLVATLRRYADIAPHVTIDRLATAWERQGTTLDRPLIEQEVEEALLRVEALDRDIRDEDRVRADVTRLGDDHRQLSKYASQSVAHLDRRRHALEPPTAVEVDAVIDDVLTVVRAYAPVIVGLDLSDQAYPAHVTPTVRALELSDWRAYGMAVTAETRQRLEASSWAPDVRKQVEAEVQVRYVWEDADG